MINHTYVVDECDNGHQFAKLDGADTGCPRCLKVGLVLARAETEAALDLLQDAEWDREYAKREINRIVTENIQSI